MTRLVVAAVVCAGLASTIARAEGSDATRPGERTSTVASAGAPARNVPAAVRPPMMGGWHVAEVPTDRRRAVPDELATTCFAEGEVRKVDEAASKLTLRHSGLVRLDMPPMTMVFRVRNPSWLHDLQVGDKVFFRADRVDGNITVTALEREPRGSR